MSEQSLPTSIVIFGASGDLTRRKLVPALFKLYRINLLPEICQIVGFASSQWNTADALLAEKGCKWRYSCAEHV